MKTYDLPPKLARKAMREADEELRAKHRRGDFDEGDPNHPKFNNGQNYAKPHLFGEEPQKFLRRQYK